MYCKCIGKMAWIAFFDIITCVWNAAVHFDFEKEEKAPTTTTYSSNHATIPTALLDLTQ